jgi:hypothetical protein
MNSEKCGKKKIKNSKPDTYQHLSVIDMKNQLKGLFTNVNKLNRQELCQELYKLVSKKKIVKKKLFIEKKEPNVKKKIKKLPIVDDNKTEPLNVEKISKKIKTHNLVSKEESISELGFINYDGSNSCYMDTSIMSLFNTPNKYIKQIILKNNINPEDKLFQIKNNILKELITLHNDLHKNSNKNAKCSKLRSLFSTFDKQYKKTNKVSDNIDWTHSQQEPRDVINMLLKIFDIKQTIKIRVTTKSDVRIEKRWFNDPIINFDVLMSKKNVYLKNYFPITTEIYTIENNVQFKNITEIIDANFLFININRNFLNETKIITPVIPEEYLTLSNKKQLLCTSILIHHGNTTSGGHYTCAFKYFKDDKWWHFDDMNNEYKLIGSFTDMLKWNNGYIKQNMVGAVYLRL